MQVWAVTLCYCSPEILARGLEAYYRTRNPSLSFRHVLVDQHFPLEENLCSAAVRSEGEKYGCLVIDPGRNLGLHRGFNWAIEQVGPAPEDVVIGYDPDSNPVSHGWDMALVTALGAEEKNAWASLMSPRACPELVQRGYTEVTYHGYLTCWVTKKPVVNSICAWRASFLRKIGGLSAPNNWYGGIEASMWDQMHGHKLQWVFTRDWWEDDTNRSVTDYRYVWYKWKHGHLREWPGDFKSYLEAGCPPPSDLPPERLP